MALRRSHTTTLVRNELWQVAATSEPYEAGWAREALFFVRALETRGAPAGASAYVQLSPDGIHWVDEGTRFDLPDAAGAVRSRGSRTSAAICGCARRCPRGRRCG